MFVNNRVHYNRVSLYKKLIKNFIAYFKNLRILEDEVNLVWRIENCYDLISRWFWFDVVLHILFTLVIHKPWHAKCSCFTILPCSEKMKGFYRIDFYQKNRKYFFRFNKKKRNFLGKKSLVGLAPISLFEVAQLNFATWKQKLVSFEIIIFEKYFKNIIKNTFLLL